MCMPEVAILGPGGVGGFLAGALERAGTPVTLIARETTAMVIEREGLHLSSVLLGDFTTQPEVVTVLERPVDYLFVATKANGLAAALERIAVVPRVVIPLLNGLDHLVTLRERFGAESVPAATIRVESDRLQAGEIAQTSQFLLIELASELGELRPELERIAELLRSADIPVKVERSEAQIMWAKLVRLNALACSTAATGLTFGALSRDPELFEQMRQCVHEACAVAQAEGATITPEDVFTELAQVHDDLTTSMFRDIESGREPELDAIPGAILRAAARHDINCPTISLLTKQIARQSAGFTGRKPAR